MKVRWLAPLTFALTALLWALTTWPLPLCLRQAIPCSALNVQRQPPQYMVPGDHLQLLYRFWLFSDFMEGHSPFGTDLYEFNRHNDAARRQPGAYYYLPFSFVYFLGAKWLGTAAGWNLTGFLSLWLTYLFTVLLLRFYAEDDWRPLVFGALAILFPYRYLVLLGGSPTGFAMLWPPLVVCGLEWGLRTGRAAGGAVAGLGLVLACFTDLQLFFFTLLLAGGWGAALFLIRWRKERRPPAQALARGCSALWLLVPALLAAYAYSRQVAHYIAGSAHLASGRTLAEVAVFSPGLKHLFSLHVADNARGAYLGYAWVLLAIAGAVHSVRAAIVRKSGRGLVPPLCWGALLGMIVVLAMGAHGPKDGALFDLVRRILPPLKMIRQPARFLTLAPTLLPVMLAVVTAPLFRQMSGRAGRILLGAFAVAMVCEYVRMTNVELCLLDTRQGAYEAVASDRAGSADAPPRALALPLWPGDSHWSSSYQYYASLYRIRMLNGYAPVVDNDYYQNVFQRFRGLNAGAVADDQLDALLALDIPYLLLHANSLPESVSPFPAAHTLNRLLAHPRLDLLGRDRDVWAFRIRATPRPAATAPTFACPVAFPARRYHPEHSPTNAAACVPDAASPRQRVVRLNQAFPSTYLGRTSLVAADGVGWLLRVRGHGQLAVRTKIDAMESRSEARAVAADDWIWLALPTPGLPAYAVADVDLQWLAGDLEIDYACFTTAQTPLRGQSFAPACFFRAGEADPATGAVLLQPDRDPKGRVFYGPRLPFFPGRYRAELHYESEAPAGALLGTWTLEQPENMLVDATEVRAGGDTAILDVALAGDAPATFVFLFAAEHPIRLLEVRVEPADAAGANREDETGEMS